MRLINWSRKTGYWQGWRGQYVNNRHVPAELGTVYDSKFLCGELSNLIVVSNYGGGQATVPFLWPRDLFWKDMNANTAAMEEVASSILAGV